MKKPGAVIPVAAGISSSAPEAPASGVVGPGTATAEAAPAAHAANGTPKKRGRPKGSVSVPKKAAAVARATPPAVAPKAQRGPVELIDRLFELAEDVGGMGALKRLVDRLAPLERA
jgi:hypothetical protein